MTSPSVHASAVLVGDRAVLIRGPSGSGKSRLAFDLILAGRAGQVPPAVLGYYTSGDIYRPDGTPVGTDDGDSLSKFAVARSTLTFRYLRDHAIEKYRVDLAKNPGVR